MSDFIAEWAFAIQETLNQKVAKLAPEEAHRWPLLRGFKAEGYTWNDSHWIIILRDEISQMPFIGDQQKIPTDSGAPTEPPSKDSLSSWDTFLAAQFTPRPQDAVIVIPASTSAGQASSQYESWGIEDKSLWNMQITNTSVF